jgi:hypothetical protein
MRDLISISICGVLVCAGLLMPACGSSGSRNGGPGLAQDAGFGGRAGAGGASSAGGALGTGGAIGSGGATRADAGPGSDGAAGGSPTKLDASIDQRPGGEAHDGALGSDAGGDGAATSIDTREAGQGATPPACAAAGGFCTRQRWTTCSAHYEPVGDGGGHLDCARSGWCCVPAPSSPCSDSGSGNCVVGTSCAGCWSAAPGTPACESGRVCCVDICD